MKEIEQIYCNDFGCAFHWKKDEIVLKDKVQVIFKETGFYLSAKEIKEFTKIIDVTCKEQECSDCNMRHRCHKFLLKTPLQGIDLAVSKDELLQIKDLMEGTLFTIRLTSYINNEGRN